MEDGAYRVEFANLEGLLINAGTVLFAAGHFEGGMGGYHYTGKFELEKPNQFRPEGFVFRLDFNVQKCLGFFGDESSEFAIVLVGHFDGAAIRGLVVRLDKPEITVPFRLTPKNRLAENAP